ncbi:hypothetical protein CL618_03465 [archaeon]|nr:hypothetical protein [archaeon]|tara:strand:+ start:96 stop:977 length:882 start_codon:yes stop_codon:yes gene_type:complete
MKEEINVKGMTCKSCVEKIENELSLLEGVEDVKVDLTEDKVIVDYEGDLEKIKEKINDLGYSTDGKKKTILTGLMYGIIPHIGCIAFIIGSILGVTFLMQFFKPLLMKWYFFHVLIAISLLFATISSGIYLRKNGLLSFKGMKKKWKYLTGMYGSTIGINLVLFMFIFPLLANVSAMPTGAVVGLDGGLKLKVKIPCPGHAPLITEELKTIDGVGNVRFSFPNVFDVEYDSSKTTEEEILALEVFETYKATVLEGEISESGTLGSNEVAQEGATCSSCGGTSCSGTSACGCGG